MIAVVDYDTGNLRSVADALHRAGAEFILTADPALLRRAATRWRRRGSATFQADMRKRQATPAL